MYLVVFNRTFAHSCKWHTECSHCHCVVRPHDTPFEDGTFKLTISFTEEYPNKPPTVRFVSKMFHPNGECNVHRDCNPGYWDPQIVFQS